MVGVEEVWPLVEVLLLPLKVVGFVHVTIAFALHANVPRSGNNDVAALLQRSGQHGHAILVGEVFQYINE